MLKASVEKIASALKPLARPITNLLVAELLVLAVLFAGVFLVVLLRGADSGSNFGSAQMQFEIVDTPHARQLGLSGREKLADHAGMLFVYEQEGIHCIWMKDMKFDLDILWLDDDRRVIDIKEQVAPDTYPESFCPDRPASYVIEVNGGQVSNSGVRESSVILF